MAEEVEPLGGDLVPERVLVNGGEVVFDLADRDIEMKGNVSGRRRMAVLQGLADEVPGFLRETGAAARVNR